MTIRAVLFDKDGTLIEVNATWVPIYRQILKELCTTDDAGAEAMMQKAGYDPATGKFTVYKIPPLPGEKLGGLLAGFGPPAVIPMPQLQIPVVQPLEILKQGHQGHGVLAARHRHQQPGALG